MTLARVGLLIAISIVMATMLPATALPKSDTYVCANGDRTRSDVTLKRAQKLMERGYLCANSERNLLEPDTTSEEADASEEDASTSEDTYTCASGDRTRSDVTQKRALKLIDEGYSCGKPESINDPETTAALDDTVSEDSATEEKDTATEKKDSATASEEDSTPEEPIGTTSEESSTTQETVTPEGATTSEASSSTTEESVPAPEEAASG